MTGLSHMTKILVLHGPNLNLLGTREPTIYGSTTLSQVDNELKAKATRAKMVLTSFQSNSEAELIQAVHKAGTDNIDYIIINPAALTHTSIALRDALCAVAIPFIEVHISNIFSREAFRHHSYFSDIAQGTITGLGVQGYLLGLDAIIEELK